MSQEIYSNVGNEKLMYDYKNADERTKQLMTPEINKRITNLSKQLMFDKERMEKQFTIFSELQNVLNPKSINNHEIHKQNKITDLNIPKPVQRIIPTNSPAKNEWKHISVDLPIPDKWSKDYKIIPLTKPFGRNNMCKYDIVLESIPKSDSKMVDNNNGSFELYVNNGIEQVVLVVVQRGIGRYICTKNAQK